MDNVYVQLLDDLTEGISSFIAVCKFAGQSITANEFEIAVLSPPHQTKSLPKNKIALYGFFYESKWYKIGIVGSKSSARFHSQHYFPGSSKSNLAKTLIADPVMNVNFPHSEVGEWMRQNFYRVNILISKEIGIPTLRLLEAFFHVKFSPIYERNIIERY